MNMARFTEDDIKSFFVNTPQITFEVTETCNLNCTYCGYGKYYLADRTNSKKSLSQEKAITFLNEYIELLSSHYNKYYNRELTIGFYGGEPLVNFELIKNIVNHIEDSKVPHRIVKYNMTTNGVLLDKYIRFLVEKEFRILISLDGDEKGNSYRIDHNGRPSFKKVIENVMRIKAEYPKYFHDNVQFNAVIHNLNSTTRTKSFIEETFNKTPTMAELNQSGINPKYYNEFQKMYRSIYEETTSDSIDSKAIVKPKATDPMFNELVMYLKLNSPFSYNTYLELLFGKSISSKKTPSGTCLPFSKKVFITANGDIMACEKISFENKLGVIAHDKVQLDYQSIAERYNRLFEDLEKQCKLCSEKESCSQCAFFIPKGARCPAFSSKEIESHQKSKKIKILSDYPEIYSDIMTNIHVD
ncbi:Anaerobic sulfatase-maturating enzyme [Porphyromonas levii]|nr:Anaerobic sulfatase-maturating enzyme [Porphyromonas levii]MBR8759837.1 Anaerobic sulfatase-maturating enzyme [Porphyromonas levii]MBR8764364.1 Anaerobic sulfatase-maturating enzyme [Porphyromonas levii]MBR8765474.1 Anaerobic sulfatase-maturating enzyme [Porphyromonas levii]MBR8801980.1 Anaerobic sulfatase-maturating enzyme [Porphyromonas levii]